MSVIGLLRALYWAAVVMMVYNLFRAGRSADRWFDWWFVMTMILLGLAVVLESLGVE